MVTTPDGPATRVASAPRASRPAVRCRMSWHTCCSPSMQPYSSLISCSSPGQRLGADPPCTLDRLLRLRLGPTGGSLSLGDSSGPVRLGLLRRGMALDERGVNVEGPERGYSAERETTLANRTSPRKGAIPGISGCYASTA